MSEINLNNVMNATKASLETAIPEILNRFNKQQILEIARRILTAKTPSVFENILGSGDVNQALGLVYEQTNKNTPLSMDEFQAIEQLVDAAIAQSTTQ